MDRIVEHDPARAFVLPIDRGIVHVVALAELVGSLELETEAIAAALSVSAYDLRVSLSRPLPRVVLRSAERGAAAEMVAWLRARGHGALACDTSEVVAAAQMVQVHRFSFDDAALWADGADQPLPWGAVAAILLVAARTEVARTTSVKELIPLGRPRSSVAVNVERTALENATQESLYLIPRDGARPWLLSARDVQYLGLGSRMHLTRRENFNETLALLRARSTDALFDDRFFKHALPATHTHHVRGRNDVGPSASDAGVDLVVHLLARWLLRDRAGPYRSSGERTAG